MTTTINVSDEGNGLKIIKGTLDDFNISLNVIKGLINDNNN